MKYSIFYILAHIPLFKFFYQLIPIYAIILHFINYPSIHQSVKLCGIIIMDVVILFILTVVPTTSKNNIQFCYWTG